ncbi:hypothetical protein BMS3Abin03_00511 [bacterium BMS3Abin03]|nr:hypothetical protein BMS3Abin03_00511 [bacterium BMS3Abin03]
MKTPKAFRNFSIFTVISFLICIALSNIVLAQDSPKKKSNQITPQLNGDAEALDINNIYLPFEKNGIIANVIIPPNGSGGQFAGHVFLFSAGFFLSGYTNGNLWANGVAPSTIVQDYLPGTYQTGSNDPNAIIYVVNSTDSAFGTSWHMWTNAVDLGADFYDGNGDGVYNPVDLNNNGVWDPNEDMPDLLGDRTLWCVYYDGVPAIQRRWNTVNPQGIEIKQTVFAYAMANGSLSNTIFIRYRIRNTGLLSPKLDSVYFATWADPDIGQYDDDVTGSDVLLQAGYSYNHNSDGEYGNQPPTFLADQIGGPTVYIPGETFIDNNGNGEYDEGIDTPIDTAQVMRGQNLGIRTFPGAKNMSISSFVEYLNGDPALNDPSNKEEARNYMLGLNRIGEVIDPCTFNHGVVLGGVDCSTVDPFFWFSGDPVTNVGWISTDQEDVRQMLTTGPFTLKENEEKEIFVAYIVGQGSTPLGAIPVARQWSHDDQIYYDNNFDITVSDVSSDNTSVVDEFQLFQNYPNPFNPSTKIKFTIPQFPLLGGDGRGGLISLKVYDVLGNEVATLIDEQKPAGTYEVVFNAGSLSSGIYFYTLQYNNSILSKKMILLK